MPVFESLYSKHRAAEATYQARGPLGGYDFIVAFRRPTIPLRMYIGGLDVGTTEPDLHAAFARIGVHLAHVELVVNRATGCPRGFAFVVLAGLPAGANADAVLARMRLAAVNERPVTVQLVPEELVSHAIRASNHGVRSI
jgi:hypothetical protein